MADLCRLVLFFAWPGLFQGPQQPFKALLIEVVVFPVSKVANMSRVLDVLRPIGRTGQDFIIQTDRVQDIGNACWFFKGL